jgi:phosphonate transport system substrate-binding protein
MARLLEKRPAIGKIALISLSLILFLSTGCSKNETPPPRERTTEKVANSRETLTIGLIPEHNIFRQMERYKPLARYLSKQIGMDVEMKILSRYGNIVDNFTSNDLDGAFFGSFTYALAHAKLGVEVVARPEDQNGTSTYYGLIFVRRDSGIKKARDLKEKRFAFVDKATTAGYLLPLDFFRDQGIEDYHTFFSESYFTGSHEDAIYDVLNGKADIGAAKNTVYFRLAKEDPRIMRELAILVRSPDVPENGLALRKDLDPSLKVKIKEALLNMNGDPAGAQVLRQLGAKRFIATTDEDYAAVFKYAEHVGLDLKTYDYVND